MPDESDPSSTDQPFQQQVHHSPATARVPDAVGRGVFATGVIILGNQHEVVLDFVQGISNPRRVAARVVLSHAVAAQFLAAFEGNLGLYASTFGRMPGMLSVLPASPPPATEPQPAAESSPPQAWESAVQPPEREAVSDPPAATVSTPAAPPIADIYGQIKLPDEMLGGVYANVVAISHTAAEFCFDFIASFYPRSVVTARVYLAASRAPDALASLGRSLGPRIPG